MDVKEQIALAILKGAGGDVDKDYTSTAEIYRDVESIYRSQDNRQDVDPLQVELIDNGLYTYDDRNTQGYKPVEITVNVPVEDYYNSGFENGIVIQKAKLEAITITENGIYNKEDGYDEVEVNIDTQSFYDNGYNNGYNEGDNKGYERGYSEGDNKGYERGYGEGVDNGIQEQKSKLESITIEANGTYIKEDGYNEVKVALDIPKTKIYNGFRFVSEGNDDYKRIKDIDFSQYDWSGVYDLSYFFEGFDSSKTNEGLVASDFDNFIRDFDGDILSCECMFDGSDALLESPNFGNRTENCLNMRYMFNGCYNLQSVPYIGTKNTKDMRNMFSGCSKLTTIPLLDCSSAVYTSYMFNGCNSLTTIPQLDCSSATDVSNMFQDCKSLTTMPPLDCSSALYTSYMFKNCESLTTIPQLDCSNAIGTYNMFDSCRSLTTISQLDCSSTTNTSYMFNNCESLTTIPQLNTKSVSVMDSMFNNCKSLTTIPLLDCSSATNMRQMFNCCELLTTIPQLITSNVTDMAYMFGLCHSLITIPQIDMSKVTNVSNLFRECNSLKSLPLLNWGSVTQMSNAFGYANINSITDLGGFKDLGKQSSLSGVNNGFLNFAPNLTHESLMNVINNLYDRKSNGLSTLTIAFGTTNINKLTDEEKSIVTNKGWNLS